MFYHGSPTKDIEYLVPNETTFRKGDEAHVYLSSYKAHAALYAAKCHMYPYGFDKDNGLPKYHEPFEGCLKEFYGSKKGYIYTVEEDNSIVPLEGIRYGFLTKESVEVKAIEFFEDIYEQLLRYEENGEIVTPTFHKSHAALR